MTLSRDKQTLRRVRFFVHPFVQQRRRKKTLLDAKHGYHSVVLKKGESREVTEFLCEFGRYRCVGSGQGLICSGDAYTHRFDKIMQNFTNVVRCVDNSLVCEYHVKSMFDSTCRYISTCSREGINFNKNKF